ncbi:binding protein isoform X2 [Wolffia australiana]
MDSRGGSKPRAGCRIGSGSLGEIYVGGVQPNEESAVRLVYRLTPDEKWDDQGTGHVTVDYLERTEDLGLIVIDEEDNETILVHRISGDDIYRRQEDTIISWRDPDLATDCALSFQEATGCSYIWDRICGAQRNLHFSTIGNDAFHSASRDLRELPPVELSSLPLLLKTVMECGNSIADQMHMADLILQDLDFFPKLMNLFRMCEDLENIENLQIIFKLVKATILLNSPQIFDRIFADDFIIDIIGALEYDPDVPQMQKHRSFLKEHVVFKEVIPIKDPQVLSRIHQSYRIGYIKDVILPRALDEGTMASLNSIIHGNNTTVISLLKDDTSFIHELFERMRLPMTSMESRRNLVLFLQEFCSLSKSLQLAQQLRLFRELANEDIFEILTDVLQNEDKKLVLTGTDILILFLNQDANLLRNFVVQQEDCKLFGLLVKGLITDFGESMNCQFLEILRILLESYTSSSAQSDAIIEIFYDKYLDQLVDVITSCRSSTRADTVEPCSSTKPEILSSICELLCFCVLHHPYRIKCNFIVNNVIGKVLCLTRKREKYLVVAAVRFMRTIVSRNDEFLTRHIVKNNLMRPIIEAFVRNGNRYNMLQSAVLELLEYIRKDKTLTLYVFESFWDQLSKFQHLSTIAALRTRYEQSLEKYDMTAVAAEDLRKRIDERALEKEEEDYFNEQSDGEESSDGGAVEEETQSPMANGTSTGHSPARQSGLVDYEDDDEDEEENSSRENNPPTCAVLKRGKEGEEEAEHLSKKCRLNGGGEEGQLSDVAVSACSTSTSVGEEEEPGDRPCPGGTGEKGSCPGGRQPVSSSSASADVPVSGAAGVSHTEPYPVR